MRFLSHRESAAQGRAALYARVSTEEQAMHGVSLDAQRECLLRYAREHGLTVAGLYVDEGISARKRYTVRPAFMRMLEDVRAGKLDVILFIKLDRWFRSIADYYEVQAILDRHGVAWIATEEDYDTATANGRLALNIKLAIAQDESDRTSERIRFVFSNMVKEGRVITGKLPLGYRIENKRPVVDEATAPIVRALFESFIDTRSQRAAAREILSRYGISLDARTVRRMLTNRRYLGEAYGMERWCPPLVERETFALAGELLSTRATRTPTEQTEQHYLFGGLLYCGLCGRRMSAYTCRNTRKDGSESSPFFYYRCPAHATRECDMRRQVNQQVLEESLLSLLDAACPPSPQSRPSPPRRAPARAERTRLLERMDRLKDLYLNDLLPRSLYEKEYAALLPALRRAEQTERTDTAEGLSPPQTLSEAYLRLPPEARRAFWSRILLRIAVNPAGELSTFFRQNAQGT